MTSQTPVDSTKSGILTLSGEVTFLKTPKAKSFGEYQIDSLLHVQILEFATVEEPVVAAALGAYHPRP